MTHIPKQLKSHSKMLTSDPKVGTRKQICHGSRGCCLLCGQSRDKTTRWCVNCENWISPEHLRHLYKLSAGSQMIKHHCNDEISKLDLQNATVPICAVNHYIFLLTSFKTIDR